MNNRILALMLSVAVLGGNLCANNASEKTKAQKAKKAAVTKNNQGKINYAAGKDAAEDLETPHHGATMTPPSGNARRK
jgi:hypothetical protein